MKRVKLLFILILSAAALWAVLFFGRDELPQIRENLASTITEQIEKVILTPPPLRAEKESPQSFLTKEGVVEWTNIQRVDQGLLPLKENLLLDSAASVKAQDMLENQYFAHESPSGSGVSDLADKAGYEFIMIGENLALGNFEDDQTLVQAWMDSPGHRANILNERYAEIGVGVVRGVYEGQSTWLAVQHFGLPLYVCPQPSSASQGQIESNQIEIDNLQIILINLEQELKFMRRKDREAYNKKADEYNSLVSQYNNLVEETKFLVEQYNLQVSVFNNCVAGI